ncbi:MAG: hypothetical protein JKY95_17580 [Planctomycetaceae bacterium]|nr:hypothetical protein [Planctomycetaceae bacterium]
MDSFNKDAVIKALEDAGAELPCPRCGNSTFMIADGYISNPLQDDLETMKLLGKSIPTIVVICEKCGYIAHHAIGVLGLFPPKAEEEAKND